MKTLGQKAKAIVWIIVSGFIILYLYLNLDQLSSFDYRVKAHYVVASLAFALSAYVTNIAVWIRIATKFGTRAHCLEHAHVWSASRLGRYIPGKVASIYMRIDGYAGQRPKAGLSLYVETTSSLVAIFTCVLAFSIAGTSAFSPLHFALLLIAAILLATLSSRRFIRAISTKLPTLRQVEIPDGAPDLKFWPSIVLMQIIVMALHGLSLFFAISAVHEAPLSAIPEITIFYYFSGIAGMLALFAPAGIGVREAVLAGLLKTIIPFPAAVASVALVRIISVAAEVLVAATARALYRRSIAS